ncbi:hypothetical protein X949_5144 [Burkholderia pseudomallei MSHR5609]|nr:hypothetical protein X989_5618 [Burkholderia pseudomallei MSHR4378]KGS54713.1 hypothetical protein X949_5144 [Burkholderia pseudomallei MSHR5609]KGW74108.1 hypothetical protein Y046_6162 [Burkholderia pseudomallei MSHR2990]KGX54088.1 hypothetical protein Y024_5190 [Burkholderia pseudomallei TSV44]KGX99357.1 hypothetical protein X997_4103 [Burkholderia pseudomallei A79C]
MHYRERPEHSWIVDPLIRMLKPGHRCVIPIVTDRDELRCWHSIARIRYRRTASLAATSRALAHQRIAVPEETTDARQYQLRTACRAGKHKLAHPATERIIFVLRADTDLPPARSSNGRPHGYRFGQLAGRIPTQGKVLPDVLPAYQVTRAIVGVVMAFEFAFSNPCASLRHLSCACRAAFVDVRFQQVARRIVHVTAQPARRVGMRDYPAYRVVLKALNAGARVALLYQLVIRIVRVFACEQQAGTT